MTMGDFSRDPETTFQDAINKNYCRVRFQQGKPLLDRELNLLGDIASPQQFAAVNFGNGVRGDGNDFLITGLSVPNNDFTITAGSCLVNGLEAVLGANVSYKNQPNNDNVAALPGGASNVYLRVFRTETAGADDALLLNAGDVGSETAIREKVDWEVLVTTQNIDAIDHFLLASINTGGPSVQDRRRKGLNVGSIRDELTTARGSTPQLALRLNASLTPAGALLPNIVTGSQIADNGVSTTKIADNAVVTQKIADNAVTTQKIADNAVVTQKIADSAVTSQKIADNAVTVSEIADNSVVTNKIANNAVIGSKIADGNITSTKIAAQAVTEPSLANNSVSNRTIVAGAVSIAKMNASQIVNLQVTVAAAPAAGQRSEAVVTIQESDDTAFFLVSCHFDGPRPALPPQAISSRTFDWQYRVALAKPPGQQLYRHFHQVVIQNPNTAEITVTVRGFRLAET